LKEGTASNEGTGARNQLLVGQGHVQKSLAVLNIGTARKEPEVRKSTPQGGGKKASRQPKGLRKRPRGALTSRVFVEERNPMFSAKKSAGEEAACQTRGRDGPWGRLRASSKGRNTGGFHVKRGAPESDRVLFKRYLGVGRTAYLLEIGFHAF